MTHICCRINVNNVH